MCGIAGLIDRRRKGAPIVDKMLACLAHRGPDGGGVLTLTPEVTFGHRRLAIVGKGATGHQPMQFEHLALTYNGEIYNHGELRRQLKLDGFASNWRGSSDTETLLKALASWGVERTLKIADGMFAFALWNSDTQTLTLARDRMGEKPLYFGWHGDCFAFASELSAVSLASDRPKKLCVDAARGLLTNGFVRGFNSLVQGVYRLSPGTFLSLGMHDLTHGLDAPDISRKIQRYWDLRDLPSAALDRDADELGATRELDLLLRESIRSRMISEVPIGSFLSGGIDSSLITALMQQVSDDPVHTFSIGFEDPKLDELPHARRVSQHLGTIHTEFRVTVDDALQVAQELPMLMDEPIADTSQIPTILLARLAKSKVTVALSGDGADELFGGYGRYRSIVKTWQRMQAVPHSVREVIAAASSARRGRLGWDGRLARAAARSTADTLSELQERFVGTSFSHHLYPAQRTNERESSSALSLLRQVMLDDQLAFLPDDILQKVDRATMLSGLESRSPFLDPRIVSYSWGLPARLLPLSGPSKPLLRRILDQYVPRQLIDRPKQGFEPPMAAWLRGPLRMWAAESLTNSALASLPFIDQTAVHAMWRGHLAATHDFSRELWPVVMLCTWTRAHGVNS